VHEAVVRAGTESYKGLCEAVRRRHVIFLAPWRDTRVTVV
jgi:hypothetical protein